MTSSAFLALLFGAYILCVSVPMIMNNNRLISMMEEFIESAPLIFLTGVLALLGGLSVISFHNVWILDWRGLITFFGWVAAIEGAILIAAPEPLIAIARSILKRTGIVRVLGALYLILGAYFLYGASL